MPPTGRRHPTRTSKTITAIVIAIAAPLPVERPAAIQVVALVQRDIVAAIPPDAAHSATSNPTYSKAPFGWCSRLFTLFSMLACTIVRFRRQVIVQRVIHERLHFIVKALRQVRDQRQQKQQKWKQREQPRIRQRRRPREQVVIVDLVPRRAWKIRSALPSGTKPEHHGDAPWSRLSRQPDIQTRRQKPRIWNDRHCGDGGVGKKAKASTTAPALKSDLFHARCLLPAARCRLLTPTYP